MNYPNAINAEQALTILEDAYAVKIRITETARGTVYSWTTQIKGGGCNVTSVGTDALVEIATSVKAKQTFELERRS